MLKRQHFTFPPDDLMHSLVNLYFSSLNTYSPLLHRPTFEKAVLDGLHLQDDGFASTLLLVCALGARLSNDRRVLLERYDDRHSSGWQWFLQALAAFKIVKFTPPRLYDIQSACVSRSCHIL